MLQSTVQFRLKRKMFFNAISLIQGCLYISMYNLLKNGMFYVLPEKKLDIRNCSLKHTNPESNQHIQGCKTTVFDLITSLCA